MSYDWEFFTEQELRCQGTLECKMNQVFMDKLIKVRKKFNTPMVVTSGYRHPAHNMVIGGAKNSPHTYGRAVDIHVVGKDAYRLIKIAMDMGMKGIGVSQRGPYEKRFIHLDDMEHSDEHPRPWIWSYK
jgi:zinc D-Ala-D-Ala carboxypeptidase